MAIEKMNLLDINSTNDNLEDVLVILSELDNFHPEKASKIIESVHGSRSMNADNPYGELLNEITATANRLGIELVDRPCSEELLDELIHLAHGEETADAAYSKENIQKFIKELQTQSDLYDRTVKEFENMNKENQAAMDILSHIETSSFSFDELFSCKYLKIRFGRLPIADVDYLDKNGHYAFVEFKREKNFVWCAYLVTKDYVREVDNLFSSISFERVKIPEFIHGTPNDAMNTMKEEVSRGNEYMETVLQSRQKYISKVKEQVETYFIVLNHLNETYAARKYVVGLGNQFEILGFAKSKDAIEIKKKFETIEGVRVRINDPYSDKRLVPPTILKNNWFTKPFEMFVEMYGLPAYGQMDPTPFVALTYTILFGIMFGDLGQGLLLSLIGLFASKKMHMKLGDVGVRIGLSSAAFGLLYGSFFGDEEILTPFFTEILGLSGKPIHTLDPHFTMTLLLSTVAIGAILIITSIVLNTIQNFRNHRYGEALFSQNGLAGVVFYAGLLGGIALQMGLGMQVMTMPYILLVIVLPLILIFFKEPLTHKIENKELFPEGFGGFFVESLFESLEICLTFVANTMSFLRIGGFVLSHAGMMLVVYVLAGMVGSTFSPLVLIIGNLFVMGLEGMIVGIQVLRLEFYEMFSRYYDGGGIEFKSIKEITE